MSRVDRPKQLVPFIRRNGRSMSLLEMAVNRLEGLAPADRRYICTNEGYRAAVRSALPGFADELILGEPVGRDTVNAVGFAAAVIHKRDPKAVFAVLTADHIIEPEDLFRDRMELGFELVEADPSRLVTFSITPTYPATGYGYVERGSAIPGAGNLAYRVERFVEKPSYEKAQAYLESGAFGWNSGMFVWSAATILDCLRRYKPESYTGLMRIASAWGTGRQRAVLEEVYPTLPRISVDYAIMEPATREQARANQRGGATAGGNSVKVCTVLMDLSWLDVGSWPAFAQTVEADGEGNRVSGVGRATRCKQTLIVNADDRHTVTALGCEGLVIVHTEDATLVMPAARAEELKLLHAELPEKLR